LEISLLFAIPSPFHLSNFENNSHPQTNQLKSVNMLRTITRNAFTKTFKPSSAGALSTRGYANKTIEDNTQAAGEAKDTNPQNPSVISSAGAIGKQFNPDGNIGQVGEAVRYLYLNLLIVIITSN
jgi:hypothetical protein